MPIRDATEADLGAIRRLLDEQNAFHAGLAPAFFRLGPTADERIRRILEDEEATLFVAENSGAVVGLAEIRLTRTKSLPVLVQKICVFLQELYVAEALRGQGIGTELLQAARAWARDRGAESMRTTVVPTNDAARAFYDKHGFTDTMISLEANL